MYVFFFDLDNTLLPTDSLTFLGHASYICGREMMDKRTRQNAINKLTNLYRNIRGDQKLLYLLNSLKYPKYIITNASRIHCMLSLKNLGIINQFTGGVDANNVTRKYLKPHFALYYLAHDISKIKKNNKCVFFDDLPQNMIIPKKMGWITVLIGTKRKNEYCDFAFPDIYKALEYFIKNT